MSWPVVGWADWELHVSAESGHVVSAGTPWPSSPPLGTRGPGRRLGCARGESTRQVIWCLILDLGRFQMRGVAWRFYFRRESVLGVPITGEVQVTLAGHGWKCWLEDRLQGHSPKPPGHQPPRTTRWGSEWGICGRIELGHRDAQLK